MTVLYKTHTQKALIMFMHYSRRTKIFGCVLRQQGHLEMAPPFTAPCEGREAWFLHCSPWESNPRPTRGSPLHYRCATPAPHKIKQNFSDNIDMDVECCTCMFLPCRVGSVGSMSASRTVGREFASRPGHTKDNLKNGTNCLPA